MTTLDQAINLFLGEHKPTSAASYGYELRQMSDFVGGARPVEGITPALMIEYHQWLRSKNYAPATLTKKIKSAKIFFSWCARLELVPRSPATALKQPRPPRAITRDKAMREDELSKILAAVEFKPRDTALILFLADTGVRRGAAAGMRIGDLDMRNRRAVVTGKGDKTRTVSFGWECDTALKKWLAKRNNSQGDYVWHRYGAPMQAANVSRIVRRACEAAGVRSLGAHSLRHRKGHQFADARIAPSVAATALGHSDVVITLTHYYPSDEATAESEMQRLSYRPAGEKTIRFKSDDDAV